MFDDPFAPKRGRKNSNPFGGGLDFGLGQNTKSTNSKRTKCPPHLKSAIRRRWWKDKINGTCFCCGRKLHYDDADVGHIKAHAKGGNWSPDNCRLICRQCNGGMRTQNMKVYMKKYYPERYEKYFPKDEKTKTSTKSKKKTSTRKVDDSSFGGSIFGASPKRKKSKSPFDFRF